MPELPDLQVFARNIEKTFAGSKLVRLNVIEGKSLTDSEQVLNEFLQGKTLKSVYRSGKELRFQFDKDLLLGMHYMLHGNLFEFEEDNKNKFTVVELVFSNGKGLALTDWQKKANIKLTPVDKEGVDALSDQLDVDYLKKVLQSKAKVKNVLTDQKVIRGIGNAYADEILWTARISPFSISKAIPDEKISDLVRSIKEVFVSAQEQIEARQPDIISGEVRDFLKIHKPKAKQSETGAEIKMDKSGGRSTYYTDEQTLYK